MTDSKKYENYPWWIVILSNLFSLLIYASGFLILFRLGWVYAVLYLAFVLLQEYRLISKHCIDCYYWGRTCAFGKGRLSSLFFKKGDTSKFCAHKMTWKEMIPDLLVSAIPFVVGVVLLIVKFDIKILVAVVLLLVLSSIGNGFIRGALACKYCKQKELGCPAEKLFSVRL